MAATENELGALHIVVAKILKTRIEDSDICTAADVNAAIKFLKDNNITCAPGKGGALDELTKGLQEQANSNKVSPVDDKDLRAALDAVGHMQNTGAIN